MGLLVKEKQFYKKVAVIAVPISLQSMISVGVNMVDTIMAGALGEAVMSATSLANQYIMIYNICCMGIGMGASVLTARFWGMQDIVSLKKVVTIMLRFCIGLGFLFTLPAIFAPSFIMRIYTGEADVIAQGVLYFKFLIPTFILQGLSLTCTIVLRSVGKVKIPLFASIVACIVNIFFTYMFMFGKFGAPRMDIQGAALGTLIARFFEFLIICGNFFFADKLIGYRIKDLLMKCKSMLKDYITISLPVFISDAILAFGNSAVAMVMGRIGAGFVAANAITTVTQQLSSVLIQGVSHAGCIVTGHTLGSGNREKTEKQAWTFLLMGVVIGAMAGGIIWLISAPVINFYNITEETRLIAFQLMEAIALIVVFQSANSIMTKGVLRGGGDTKFLMVADILFLWLASIPLGALAGLVWNLPPFWIYIFLKIDQVIKAFWCVFRLKSGKWIKTIKSQEKSNCDEAMETA